MALVSTAWDVQRYADRINPRNTGIGADHREEALSHMFKPVDNAPALEIMPCTITDRHHRLLLWYLPNILRSERQVNAALCNARRCLQPPQQSMFADLRQIEAVLKINHSQPTNWRNGPEFYRPVEGGLKPGTMNISPAWFEQGHEVCGYLPNLQFFDDWPRQMTIHSKFQPI